MVEKEQNMTVQVIISIVALVIGLIIGLSRIEWIIVILLIGLVLASELINTSIEATLDVAKSEIDPVVKIAKDTAAAAVLVFCVMAIIVGLIIYIPNIVNFIKFNF
jgi:diacylglycerol kinase